MKSALENDFEYYIQHQDELVREHAGKFLVIKDRRVLGVCESVLEAVKLGSEKFPLGTFLVQKCEPGTESYTQTFHSRVLV